MRNHFHPQHSTLKSIYFVANDIIRRIGCLGIEHMTSDRISHQICKLQSYYIISFITKHKTPYT